MVTAPGMGDEIQAMKAGILEVADLIVINKADHPGADNAVVDMEAVLKERGIRDGAFTKVHKTVASEGKGIAELAVQLEALAHVYQESGEQGKRRTKAYQTEVFAWAMELLKPQIQRKVSAYAGQSAIDPRLKAKEIITREMKNMDFDK
jgi:LAO/AO transport system kinase